MKISSGIYIVTVPQKFVRIKGPKLDPIEFRVPQYVFIYFDLDLRSL